MRRLTKEELALRAKFNFKEKELALPELGQEDAGILLRVPSIEKLHVLERKTAAYEDKDRGINSPVGIADLLATYCAEPEMTSEEWLGLARDWPSQTLGSIVEACAELAGKTEEESRALATEFRDS